MLLRDDVLEEGSVYDVALTDAIKALKASGSHRTILEILSVMERRYDKAAEFWKTAEIDPYNISAGMHAAMSESRDIFQEAIKKAK